MGSLSQPSLCATRTTPPRPPPPRSSESSYSCRTRMRCSSRADSTSRTMASSTAPAEPWPPKASVPSGEQLGQCYQVLPYAGAQLCIQGQHQGHVLCCKGRFSGDQVLCQYCQWWLRRFIVFAVCLLFGLCTNSNGQRCQNQGRRATVQRSYRCLQEDHCR